METILFGIFTFVIGEISKKTKIPTTYVIGICIIFSSILYSLFVMYNPDFAALVVEFAIKTFAISQAIWMFYNKFLK